MVGDVHPGVWAVAGAVSPVPGGVGPLTIAMLLQNTLRAAGRGSPDCPASPTGSGLAVVALVQALGAEPLEDLHHLPVGRLRRGRRIDEKVGPRGPPVDRPLRAEALLRPRPRSAPPRARRRASC